MGNSFYAIFRRGDPSGLIKTLTHQVMTALEQEGLPVQRATLFPLSAGRNKVLSDLDRSHPPRNIPY